MIFGGLADVVCGNAFEIVRNLPDKVFDTIITDPDYALKDLELDQWIRVTRGNLLFFCAPENQYFKPDEYLFWIKTPSTKNTQTRCSRFVEMILVKRQGPTFNRLHWSQMTGVFDDRLIWSPIHPFEKPPSLIDRLIRIYSNPGDLIFDPFAGSGTILKRSLALGRRVIGIEQDQVWVDHIQEFINGKTVEL